MLETQCTSFSKTSLENVWKLWSDPKTWSSWDLGVEWCELKKGQKFQLNAEAKLMPKGAKSPINVKIIEFEENKKFTDEAKTELGSIIFVHEMSSFQDGINITHTVFFKPYDKEKLKVFENGLWLRIKEDLPKSVERLARFAEKDC